MNLLPRYVLLACLWPCFAFAQSASGPQQASAAYDAKDFVGCARLYGELANLGTPPKNAAYNAACCLALAGDKPAAFKRMKQAIDAEFIGVHMLESDADLTLLRADPDWPALLAQAQAAEDRHLAGVNRQLRDEFLARQRKDQAARQAASADPKNRALVEAVMQIDRDNTQWLKQVIKQHGWPGKRLVYTDGAQAAWLFAQHADLDPAFQKEVLELMKPAVASGDASGRDLAYLTDRVLTAEGRQQLYGTQFHTVDGTLVPQPIEDEANVDSRRAAIGLGSMAEYTAQMGSVYRQPVDSKSRPAKPASTHP